MSVDLVLFTVETLLLVVIVWQGFKMLKREAEVADYSRQTFLLYKEYFDERRAWREAQRKNRATKKSEQESKDGKENNPEVLVR